MAFQACLETHCIGELGDDDDDNGDIADMISNGQLLCASNVADRKICQWYLGGFTAMIMLS